MTGQYTGDCCPACGSYQVLPYAVILGGREEYGYHCQDCQITWRVLTYPEPAAATGSAHRARSQR
jgi:transposase-like protein